MSCAFEEEFLQESSLQVFPSIKFLKISRFLSYESLKGSITMFMSSSGELSNSAL